MPAGRRSTLRSQPRARGMGKSSRREASEKPKLVEKKDPFECIPLECCNMILNNLALDDLGRSAMVSSSWNRVVTSWISSFGFAVHFPYADGPQSGADGALVLHEFKRLACQQHALARGEAISARRFPEAYHFTMAGDFVAWASKDDNVINYQRLKQGAKTWALDQRAVGGENQLMSVKGMDLNSDGFLLMRLRWGPSVYALDYIPFHSYRDVIYSLRHQALIWEMESTNIYGKALPRYTPLCIGKDRVYMAYRNSNDAYELVAEDFRSRTRLYQTTVLASIDYSDEGFMPTRTLELIRLKDEELIVQFDSRRLLFPMRGSIDSFTIINCADGRIQKIDSSGFQRCDRAFANSSSNCIAIVGSSVRRGEIMVQKFSQQADKTFKLIAVHVVSMLPHDAHTQLVFHPFIFRTFSIHQDNLSLQALTLTHDQNLQTGSEEDTITTRYGPEVVVDAYHCTIPGQPLTLPSRNPSECGRRAVRLLTRRNDLFNLHFPDGGRLVFGHTKIESRHQRSSDKYVFSFTTKPYRVSSDQEDEIAGE